MNFIYQTRFVTKAVSVLGATACAVLITLPGLAQSSRPSGMNAPNVGPSETPSGSPSVPGNSGVDDPGMRQNGSASEGSSVEQNALDNSDEMQNDVQGPSVVPGETAPGASETPSGSPSVPGNSGVDDPGASRMSPSVQRDALDDSDINDTPSIDDDTENAGPSNVGPSVVPSEGAIGPSETPSGSPSVPGNSGVDDPGNNRL